MKLKPKKLNAAFWVAFEAGPPIHGFDRITLWLDRSDLPISESVLSRHCTQLNVFYKPMEYNSNWKTKLEIHQPTAECLRLLSDAVGSDVNVHINYVEIACDTPAISNGQSNSWLRSFLASVRIKYQRQTVKNHLNTWYFGRRTIDTHGDQSGNADDPKGDHKDRRGNVVVIYADRASKLNNAQPEPGQPSCLHIEWRSSGAAALARLGIVSLEDLIHFDHQLFWNTHVALYQLPRLTDLGRLLPKSTGADSNVSGSALRKRANKWIEINSIDGNFVMHNALLATRGIGSHLSIETFTDWLAQLVSIDQH